MKRIELLNVFFDEILHLIFYEIQDEDNMIPQKCKEDINVKD
jgi:hypothetical protein